MKKILVLDEDQSRHNAFHDLLRGNDVTHVYSYADCVSVLRDTKFDVVFLEHDIGSYSNASIIRSMHNSKPLTGTNVVQFMKDELTKEFLPGLVVVHTHNRSGSYRMIEQLQYVALSCEAAPFDFTFFKNKLSSWLRLTNALQEQRNDQRDAVAH